MADNELLIQDPEDGETQISEEKVVFKFKIETLRIFSLCAFLVLLLVCTILTRIYVDPVIPPETTVIYKLFGFNHACNNVDHNPSRQVAALSIVFFSFPYCLFLFLQHLRLKMDVEEDSVPRWQLTFSKVVLPFNLYVNAILYMWFVNTPEISGFVPHYLPYLAFRLSLAIVAFQQVQYLRAMHKIPFGINDVLASFYTWVLIIVSAFSQICVLTIVFGDPILDSKNNLEQREIFEVLATVQTFFIFAPIVLAWDTRNRSEVNTITFM